MRALDEVEKQKGVKRVDRGEDGGVYFVKLKGRQFAVIASYGMSWDHVSVSLSDRTPRWDEMETIKRLFFKPNEWAMQLHAPPSKHINIHSHTLHLWAPHPPLSIPIPHPLMV